MAEGIGDRASAGNIQRAQVRIAGAGQRETERRNRAQEALSAQQMDDQAGLANARLAEDRRQFNASNAETAARADASLAENRRQFDASLEADAGKAAMQQGQHDDRMALARDEADTDRMMAEQRWRQNEDAFQQTKSLFDEDERKRQAAREMQNGAFANLVRSALMNPAAPGQFVTAFNRAAGVADGQPGSITRMFRLDEDGQGNGLAYERVMPDGSRAVEKVTPEQVWGFMGNFPPETQRAVSEAYAKAFSVNDQMNIARLKYMQAMDAEDAKTARADADRLARQEKGDADRLSRESIAQNRVLSGIVQKFTDPVFNKSFTPEQRAMLTQAVTDMATGGGGGLADPPATATTVTLHNRDGSTKTVPVSLYRAKKRAGQIPDDIVRVTF